MELSHNVLCMVGFFFFFGSRKAGGRLHFKLTFPFFAHLS